MKKLDDKQLIVARQEFNSFLVMGEKGFSKLKLKTELEFFKTKGNTTYEELGCVGFNQAFSELTATVKIKRTTGYSGDLCSKGSNEYVRFYLDYQDGNGWQDMGYTSLNVHDIPTQKDCANKNEKPIDYVVRLKIKPKRFFCTKANLPKVRAVLSWNSIPAPNDPNRNFGPYTWSDAQDEYIQISPLKFILSDFPLYEIGPFLEKVILNPNISLKQIAKTEVGGLDQLKKAIKEVSPTKMSFAELAKNYKKEKIEPHRFGYSLLQKAIQTKDVLLKESIANIFDDQKLSYIDTLVNLHKMKCNTNYEELLCVGADYNQEALVGTLKIKKTSGYSGDLCKKGSKEYVSFYIQKEKSCSWIHAGTTFVEVHDIKEIPDKGLSYSVILPYDFTNLKKKCTKPQVLKVRAVLSWNTPPQGMNCSNWGNVIESYIQLKPRIFSGNEPKIVIVGGIATDEINAVSGLTIPGAKFVINDIQVYNNSPFGGVIAVQGNTASFAMQQYKVKVTNLDQGTSYYHNESFDLVGFDPILGIVTHSVSTPIAGVYTYPFYKDNIGSFMARFSPGTNDRLLITIEHISNGTSDSQVIQMDNTKPKVTMSIDDGGDCTHYTKGDTINGVFEVDVDYLESYAVTTNVGTYSHVSGIAQVGIGDNGDPDGNGAFQIVTFTHKNCGVIHLRAYTKTIWNSANKGIHDDAHITVCLK